MADDDNLTDYGSLEEAEQSLVRLEADLIKQQEAQESTLKEIESNSSYESYPKLQETIKQVGTISKVSSEVRLKKR